MIIQASMNVFSTRRAAVGALIFLSLAAGSARTNYADFQKKLAKDRQAVHVLDRLAFGPRPGDVEAVRKAGVARWIEWQLHPETIPQAADLDARLAGIAIPQLTAAEIVKLDTAKPNGKTPRRNIANEMAQAKVIRAVYSNRQLEEVLTDFWFNHFNVSLDKGADRFLIADYERDTIRPHIFGKFRDLLGATAASPAMLFYLDNWQSVAPPPAQVPATAAANAKANTKAKTKQNAKAAARGLNENYARELLELHTLGVDGGYTQKDIVEVARCFTGWSVNQPNQGGAFVFNERNHDKGEKTVLGVTIPAGGGQGDGQRVLDIVAAHPSTARFLSRKLAQRFVADDPPPSLIDAMAATYARTGGDIREVLETLFTSKEFLSKGAWQAKVKSPFELVVSAVRATGGTVDNAQPLVNRIANLGQPLYRKIEPTGYANTGGQWVSSSALVDRMNFALALGQNKLNGTKIDSSRLATKPEEIAKDLLAEQPSKQTMQSLRETEKKDPKASPALYAGLVLGSPEFQRR